VARAYPLPRRCGLPATSTTWPSSWATPQSRWPRTTTCTWRLVTGGTRSARTPPPSRPNAQTGVPPE